MRHGVRVAIAGVVGLVATLTVQGTVAAFSASTKNSGNTFRAAASFCAAPGPQTVIATQDTRIQQDLPNNNYGNAASLLVRSLSAGNRRAVVYFPLPAVPANCTLTSATLRLFAASAAGGRSINAYRAAAPWAEGTVTWSNQPGIAGAPVGSPSASGWVQWNVTSHVGIMYAGSNFGFLLRDRIENAASGQQQSYRSSEAFNNHPELVVTFG